MVFNNWMNVYNFLLLYCVIWHVRLLLYIGVKIELDVLVTIEVSDLVLYYMYIVHFWVEKKGNCYELWIWRLMKLKCVFYKVLLKKSAYDWSEIVTGRIVLIVNCCIESNINDKWLILLIDIMKLNLEWVKLNKY